MKNSNNLSKNFGIALIIIVLASNACEDILKLNVIGDGNIITDTLRWKNYNINEIELSDNFKLEIYKSEIPALHVEADSNLMVYIKTDFTRNKLTISRQSDYNLKPSKNIIIRLYINKLSLITVINRGIVVCDTLSAPKFYVNVYGKSTFKSDYIDADDLYCITEGSSTVDIKGEFKFIDYTQTGSGETFLSGSTDFFQLCLEGSGKIEALNFPSKYSDIMLRNSGLIYCRVSNRLSVDLTGTGKIFYIGSPELSIKGDGIIDVNIIHY